MIIFIYLLCFVILVYVMFKTRAAVFYRDRYIGSRVVLDPIKHVLEKRVSKRVNNNDAFVNVGN